MTDADYAVDGGHEMRENPEIIQTLEMISKMRTSEARGEEKILIAWMPDEYKNSADFDEKGGYNYYTDKHRGAVENWDNKMLFSSIDSAAMFDAFHLCEKFLTQSLCIVVGDKVCSFNTLKDSKNLYERAASKDKKILICGAASGIGKGVSERLHKESAEIFLGDFDIEGVKKVAEKLNAKYF